MSGHAPEAEKLLRELHDVLVDRGTTYGEPYLNHQRIADLMSVVLADKLTSSLTASDAVLMMFCVKIGRLMQSPGHEDSLRDIAGYAAIGLDVAKRDTSVTRA